MNRITRHISVSTLLLTVVLGAAIGYTAAGQRAVAPAAPVIAVVRIDELFDQLQQRADARIELRNMEAEVESGHKQRIEEINQLQADMDNVVAVTRRKELEDEIGLKTLQLKFWQQASTAQLEVEKALLLQNLYRSMRGAIAALAAAQGYDLVLIDDASDELPFDREGQVSPQVQVLQQIATRKLLYRNSALDITIDLATRMNNQYRAASVPNPPAAKGMHP